MSLRFACAQTGSALALLLLALTAAYAAEEVSFDIEINAPRAYAQLLRDNLDIYQWQQRRVDLDLLRQLYAKTPKQIETLLAAEGYYSPRIDASLAQRGDRWIARFDISPGEPARVSAVDIKFDGTIVQSEPDRIDRLRKEWGLPRGRVFRQPDWEQAKRKLLRALVIEHYPAARIVDSQATVDPNSRTAQLSVQIDSGPLFTFGELIISGPQRYPAQIIQNLNPIKPGAPYSQQRIFELQTRLQNTTYFKTVNVTFDVDAAQPAHVPVKVSVVEQERKSVGFGIGYSTDVGVRGKIEYGDKDIGDRAWRLTTGVEASQVRQSVYGGLDFPTKADGARDGISTAYSHQEIQGETTENSRVTLSRAQTYSRFDRVASLQYQLERQGLEGAPGDRRRALSLNGSWTRRAVDNLLYPTHGYLVNFQLGGAHDGLFSDQSFLRTYAKGAHYISLAEKDNLVLRAELGAVAAESRFGIPSDFLFRTGGDQSVRGYQYQTLGVPEGDAIVGGRYLAVGSVEYIHWFKPTWGPAVFYDRGDAADTTDTLQPVAGYGVGVRWRSPVGAINLDVAYGEQTGKYRLHFTLGFVF